VRDKRTIREGLEQCQRAVALGSGEPQLYLNLARAYSSTGRRLLAVQVLRQGLRVARPHPALQRELNRLSPRSKPVVAVLSRDHVLNKYLGRVRARLGRAG
jgi:hypothetical protein